jgi:uncharacterized membrane protein
MLTIASLSIACGGFMADRVGAEILLAIGSVGVFVALVMAGGFTRGRRATRLYAFYFACLLFCVALSLYFVQGSTLTATLVGVFLSLITNLLTNEMYHRIESNDDA